MTAQKNTRSIRVGRPRTACPAPDGRTREARLLRETRARLFQHVGGSPTATQALQIERACWLTLRLAQLDTARAYGEAIDDTLYLAVSNSLSRLLRRLGPPAPPPQPSLAEHLARRAAEREAAERAA
jgi:hypothetical protein